MLSVSLRRAVSVVAILNFAYFLVEFGVARHIASVALFADSIDFLEDAAVNFLVLVALGWSARRRSVVGMLLSGVLLVPAVSVLGTAWEKFHSPTAPDPWLLSTVGLGALAINLGASFLLVKFRNQEGSLTRAAFLSARNDAIANIAIICAGILTHKWPSGWPDLIVGLGIAAMNADAAVSVWKAAQREHHHANHHSP